VDTCSIMGRDAGLALTSPLRSQRTGTALARGDERSGVKVEVKLDPL
jgi:hypothetical protein